ncbi:MAG: hypothetical protein KGL39_13875 [Patescibacteria group bacterium]|nr:hypothetical protein [Patescibacteria group bacterium]
MRIMTSGIQNDAQTFWNRVKKGSDVECWDWLGWKSYGKRGGGYGRVDIFGFSGLYAHRVAYCLANPGRITLDKQDGQLVLHTCDNQACCNPKHLYVGDHAQNMRDKVARGRQHKWGSGENSPRAKLTREQVIDMRQKHQSGMTVRQLAPLYGMSESGIKQVVYRKYYKDIP